jgi:hypothetical protein
MVVTLGILGALLIGATTAISFSSSNARSAEYSKDSGAAGQLADAGLDLARAVL